MKTVVQRVSRASVCVGGETVGAIERGAMLLVGVEQGDTDADAAATVRKIAALRFFPGTTPMDKTLAEVGGGCLVVSQFTLAGTVKKGNRPSFVLAAEPGEAKRLYERVVTGLRESGLQVATGVFRADMEVELVNDGPVTLFVFTAEGKLQ